MSTSKISSGIDARADDAPSSRLDAPLLTATELLERAHAADKRSAKLSNILADIEAGLGRARDEIDARWDDVGDLPRDRRRTLARKEYEKARREAVRNSDEARYDELRALKESADAARAAAVHYESPAAMLSREGLGSEERSRYHEQIAHAGPAELRNLARVAVSTGNKILGAAVMSRLDAMSKDERKMSGVSRQDLSRALVGDEYDRIHQAIAAVQNRAQSALNANRAFERGGRKPGRIRAGLDARREGDVLAPAEDNAA